MSGIAGIVSWRGENVSTQRLHHMLELIAHRGPDGLSCELHHSIGLGFAHLSLSTNRPETHKPVWLPDRKIGITADARLYNRDQLLRQVDTAWLAADACDAALILAAYLKWGEGLLSRLDGDFAFVICDRARQRLFAARDPFGVKPLFYRATADEFLFGSEPKQIALDSASETRPDKLIVGEFLFHHFEDLQRSFLHDVQRVRPAHGLHATQKSCRQERYWNPAPDQAMRCIKPDEALRGFHDRFLEAVEKRLHTTCPVTAQLSGGLDSSSIVAAAHHLYRQDANRLPAFETISATFGKLSCDESRYIDAMSASTGFPGHRFDPRDTDILDSLVADLGQLDSPFADLQRAVFLHTADRLNERDARVLITGLGGDEVTHEERYLRDLAAAGRWGLLTRESWLASRYSWFSFPSLLLDALRAAVPESAKAVYHRYRPQRWRAPAWANPEFVRLYTTNPEVEPPRCTVPTSRTQEAVLQYVNHPQMCWALEALECRAAYRHFEVRHPFLDRPLVEYVMSIPLDARIPAGRWKYLLRSGLSDYLPGIITSRKRKTAFTEFDLLLGRKYRSRLSELLFSDHGWQSGDFVMERQAKQLLGSFAGTGDSYGALRDIWCITNLELWLRDLGRYDERNQIHAGKEPARWTEHRQGPGISASAQVLPPAGADALR